MKRGDGTLDGVGKGAKTIPRRFSGEWLVANGEWRVANARTVSTFSIARHKATNHYPLAVSHLPLKSRHRVKPMGHFIIWSVPIYKTQLCPLAFGKIGVGCFFGFEFGFHVGVFI